MERIRLAAGTAVLAMAVGGAAAFAQSTEPLAAKFGARESVLDVGISPEGKHLVFVAPRPDGGENAVVVSLDTGALTPVLGAKGNTEQISDCQFVIETHVVCRLHFRDGRNQDIDTASRLVVVTTDGKKMEQLTGLARGLSRESNYGGAIVDYNVANNPNAVLMTRWFNTEGQTGTIAGRSESGLAVEAVDLVSLERKRVQPPRETAVWYSSDGKGNVRLMGTEPRRESGYSRGEYNYQYRTADGGWEALSTVTMQSNGLEAGFDPVAVDAKENVAYGFERVGKTRGLYKVALDGSGKKTLVLGRDDVDIDGLLRIGRDRRIVGASYATEYRVAEYFDPELKAVATSLSKALNGRQIGFIDATADESKLIVLATNDTDPGKYYLFDKATKQLAFMMNVRDPLVGVKLGTMMPVRYPAPDGTMIPGYLTLPAGSDGKYLPAIVMPHGGPGARDEWGFDWLSQYFAARGFAVLQPNFRGSAGYGDAWFQQNGFQSWETAIGDVNAAGKWLQDQGIAAPGKLAIFGWSYGGYAALQSQVVDPSLFKAVVAVAPVTDLERLKLDDRDQASRFQTEQFVGSGPHVEAGSPAQHATKFQAPVLLFHGDADLNVAVGHSRLMEERLKAAGKKVTYVEFKELDHQLDMAHARTRMLSDSDAFLRNALGL